VCTQIFWLLEHDTFRTQRQLRDVFCRHIEFYQDREDHVDVHRDQLLSLPVILLTEAAVTRVRVVVK
jgi:hypothetical protein